MTALAAGGSGARSSGDPGLEIAERAQRGIQHALGIILSYGSGSEGGRSTGCILGPEAEAGGSSAGRLIQRAKLA
eukprot:3641390-Alexandrium_andersonii.AAC.1